MGDYGDSTSGSTESLQDHLAALPGIPLEFLRWAGGKTAQEAWDQCTRPDWLLFWAASTAENDTKSIKLATHDIASVICRPQVDPVPDWAATIWDTWQSDPRNQRRVAAWSAWAEWCEKESPDPQGALGHMDRACKRMRYYRIVIPWRES